MDEIWERAVDTALDGKTDHLALSSLTLDGAVKYPHSKLPPPGLLEKFVNLQNLSIASIGISTLERFPHLPNLQKLILSDNRISGGLEFLVEAGLNALRDLDLSNNRIQYIEDLSPLAALKLISLDLYECPVTRLEDYRSRVFGLIKSLKYLDKMDAEENERPESDEDDEEEDDDDDDDDEDEDEDEEEEEEEDDPGTGEIDGEEKPCTVVRMNNGHSESAEGIVHVEDDDESDADEEETEMAVPGDRQGVICNGVNQNGFHVAEVREDIAEDGGEEDGDESGEEEIDEDDDDDVMEVHAVEDSEDDVDDGVEYQNVDDDGEEEDEDEEVDDDDDDDGDVDVEAAPETTGRLTTTEGEIDAHEQGEADDDDGGETGEDEQGVEDDGEFGDEEEGDEEDDDSGTEYLVQPVGEAEVHDAGVSDMEDGNGDDEEDEVEDTDELQVLPSSSHQKRKRDEGTDDDDENDDVVEHSKPSKKHH